MGSEIPVDVSKLRDLSNSTLWKSKADLDKERIKNSYFIGKLITSPDPNIVYEAFSTLDNWLTNQSSESWINDFAGTLILDNWDKIKCLASNRNPEDFEKRWFALGLIANFKFYSPLLTGDFREKEAEAERLVIDNIRSQPNDVVYKLDSSALASNIKLLKYYGTKEQKEQIRPWLESRLENAGYFSDCLDSEEHILSNLFDGSDCGGLRQELSDYVKKFGIDLYLVDEYWRKPVTEPYEGKHQIVVIGTYVLKNVLTMRDLEKELPGSVRELYDRNGIVHFGNWPKGILKEQQNNKITKDKKIIFLSMPVDNYNGAGWNKNYFFNEINSQYGEEFNIVAAEIEPTNSRLHQDTNGLSQSEILEKRIGNLLTEADVPLVWMMVHGSKGKLCYSNRAEGQIGAEYFQTNNGGALLQKVPENGLIILASCSTGTTEPDGIGRFLSTISPARVIGPQEPGAYTKLKINKKNSEFEVSEVEAENERGQKVSVSTFKNGELIAVN